MQPFRVLSVLSSQDGIHIHPGSVISLPAPRAAILVEAGAIAPLTDVPPAEEVAAAIEPADLPAEEA